jgi:putative methionine-R-sulfoxide reductase with GAF domain
MSQKTTAPNTQLGDSDPVYQVSSESGRGFWQFRNYSLHTKLITAFVFVVVLSMSTVAFLANRSLSNSLTSEIIGNQAFLATSQAFQIGQAINSEYDKLMGLAKITTIQEATKAAGLDESYPTDVVGIAQLNQAWRAMFEANNTTDPLVTKVLHNPLSDELRKFQKTFPEYEEILLTDQEGFSAASTNFPTNFYQGDALWWRLAHETGQYIGQPIIDPAANTVAIDMAIPIYSDITGEFVGVMRAVVNFNVLTDLLIEGFHGQTGYSIISLPNDQDIRLQSTGIGTYEIVQEFASNDLREILKSSDMSTEHSLDGVQVLASSAPVRSYSSLLGGTEKAALDALDWQVLVMQEKSEALQPVSIQARSDLIAVTIVIIIAIMIAYFLAGVIANPIVRLNDVALKLASGDLTAKAKVETRDEIGTLAATLNSMTAQLRGLVGSLEQRVADRTKALAASTEVSRSLSTIMDPKQLVKEVVDQVQSVFKYYHVHIYLIDKSSGDLIMAGGTGEAGATMLARRHRIQKGRGLVGRAASENIPVLVTDVSQDPAWLPNPLLPETKSEIAVPIAVGDQVQGVLDVQHNVADGLKQEDVQLLLSVANQVAIGLQNARSFEQSRSQAELETLINAIGQKIQRAGTVEDVLQTAIREVGVALGASRVSASLRPIRKAAEPYTVGGDAGADLKR